MCFFFLLMIRRPPRSTRTDTLFPYTTLFRSCLHSLRRVAQGSCNANHPWFVPSPRCRIPPRDRGFEPGKDLFIRNLTKGLMGAFAAISVAATAPAYAGLPTIATAQGHGLFQADPDAGF